MVTVAKSFDVSIKLFFPFIWEPELKYSMLGKNFFQLIKKTKSLTIKGHGF